MAKAHIETLDVGSASNGKIFIGAPASMYDKAKMPISGKVKHIVILDVEEAEWLIEALQKEIDNRDTPAT